MNLVLEKVVIDGELYNLTVNNGFFTSVIKSSEAFHIENAINAEKPDVSGLVYLPTFTDMHCHLDKTFLGEGWRSRKAFVTFAEQLATEKELHASLSGSVLDRARLLAELMLSHGTTRVRTHVDMDPNIGLNHLEAILQLKEELRGRMTLEIVAFPQQGLLRSHSIPIVREALRGGADLVGAVDPGGLDNDIERCLNAVFDLSAEFDTGVDIHLHDLGQLGIQTVGHIIEATKQSTKQGHVSISHAYCLGQISTEQSAEIGYQLHEQGISIISSVPIDRPIPNIPQLSSLGVKVHLGTDDILNAWTPFGSGDMLERASRLAERFSWVEDRQLMNAYRYITDFPIKPPSLGEIADFLLVRAMNPEHALAASIKRELVFSRGTIVKNNLRKHFPNPG